MKPDRAPSDLVMQRLSIPAGETSSHVTNAVTYESSRRLGREMYNKFGSHTLLTVYADVTLVTLYNDVIRQ